TACWTAASTTSSSVSAEIATEHFVSLGKSRQSMYLRAMVSPPGIADAAASAAAHAFEELAVALGRLDLVEQEFHRLELVHRVEELAQDPDLLKDVGLQQQLLAARARAIHVDRRVDPLLGHPPVEVDLHVAGALEFLVDH